MSTQSSHSFLGHQPNWSSSGSVPKVEGKFKRLTSSGFLQLPDESTPNGHEVWGLPVPVHLSCKMSLKEQPVCPCTPPIPEPPNCVPIIEVIGLNDAVMVLITGDVSGRFGRAGWLERVHCYDQATITRLSR